MDASAVSHPSLCNQTKIGRNSNGKVGTCQHTHHSTSTGVPKYGTSTELPHSLTVLMVTGLSHLVA
jgi:hypothetical protein